MGASGALRELIRICSIVPAWGVGVEGGAVDGSGYSGKQWQGHQNDDAVGQTVLNEGALGEVGEWDQD